MWGGRVVIEGVERTRCGWGRWRGLGGRELVEGSGKEIGDGGGGRERMD